MNILHIYAQGAWHDTAHIAGNRKALEQLHGQLGCVLTNKEENGSPFEFFTTDGEGYSVEVRILSDDKAEQLMLPYTSDYAKSDTGLHPIYLV